MDKSTSASGFFSPKNRSVLRKSSISGRKQGTPRGPALSHVIYRSPINVVESFGPALPVLVREALTFSEKSASASVSVSSDGWAWFVCGRRLLVWACIGEDSRRRQVSNLCRELSLPSSDLAYRADLVTIFTSPGSQVPSCIAASPEGLVRYWPSIAHEGSSVEVNADLQGQECDSLTDLGPLGVILATTTASVVLLSPQTSGGRPSLTVKPLRPPQGWLGGITRLIPSLIFGSLQASHGMETKLVKVAGTQRGTAWLLHILAGHTLQQWLLLQGELHTLVYECDVTKLAVEAFHKTIWETSGGNVSDVQVWLLDLQPTDGGVCLLLGATNSHVSPQFFYALGTLLVNAPQQPTRFDRFCPIKANMVYRESEEAELLSCRVLLHGSSALLYTRRKLFAVSAVNFGEDVDVLDVVGPMDEILGASLCRGLPVLFTKEHGLFSVTSAGGARSDFNASVSDVATADTSVLSVQQEPLAFAVSDAELEEMENSHNPVNLLQAAFLYYLRRNNEAAERLVSSAFPRNEDLTLDTLGPVITRMSQELTDAAPAADPRWAEVRGEHVFGSTSLQIATQLEDKMRALDAFVSFLKWAKLWDKTRHGQENDELMPMKMTLAEHREKLVALLTLKQLHSTHGSILDQCIRHVVGDSIPEGLSAHDVFFCHASKVHSALQALVEWSEAAAHSDRRPNDIAAVLATANEALLKTMEAVLEWRSQRLTTYVDNSEGHEYLPWTAAPGSAGLRDSLTVQHSLTLKYGARSTGELSLRSKLYDQLLKLADVLLDGWRAHVRSVQGLPKHDALTQQYETTRLNLIKPLISDGEYERAIVLGEKYLDFHSLVQVCELTDNMERLDSYCNSFSEQNFSQFLFNWYIREGKPGHLLERFRSHAKPPQQEQLSQFLGDHPSLSWLQDVLSQDFIRAYSTLEGIAHNEKDLFQRKKTVLSLTKLCLLASDESEEVAEYKLNDVDMELELIGHQEDLPPAVLAAHGYDLSKIGVLSPADLIKLFISDHNENATESDFKTALDLLNFVGDDLERSELRRSIWCSAILRDSWTDIEPDAPIDVVLNLLFFKLVDLMECIGSNLDEVLLPIDSILEAEELGELRSDRKFQYLIRLGYEHFQKIEPCS